VVADESHEARPERLAGVFADERQRKRVPRPPGFAERLELRLDALTGRGRVDDLDAEVARVGAGERVPVERGSEASLVTRCEMARPLSAGRSGRFCASRKLSSMAWSGLRTTSSPWLKSSAKGCGYR